MLITFFLFWYEASLGRYQFAVKIWIWLKHSKSFFIKVGKAKCSSFFTWRHFRKNCLITFSLFWHEGSQGGCLCIAKRWIRFHQCPKIRKDQIKIFYFFSLYTASGGWYWSTVRRWIWFLSIRKFIFKVKNSDLNHFPIIIDIIQ